MSIPIHAGDSLSILVTVTTDGTTAKDITGAAISAQALKSDGKATQTKVTAVTAITDAAAGKFTATFPEAGGSPNIGSFTFGKWIFQPRVTIGLESQVVVEKHIDVALAHV